MYDILPFPSMNGKNVEEQVAELNAYLIQFKETLEFILTNISIDNLSQDLVSKLNELGAEIEKSNDDRDDQIQQVSNKTLTVLDVINSPAFNEAIPNKYLVSVEQVQASNEPEGLNIYAIKDESGKVETFKVKNGKTPNVKFSVNYNTGNLEYTTS